MQRLGALYAGLYSLVMCSFSPFATGFLPVLLHHDGLVLRDERLHDAPADEVGHGADAEDDHVGCGLALEPEEGEGGAQGGCPVEELTRAEVDAHGADTAGHRAEADDGADAGDGGNG